MTKEQLIREIEDLKQQLELELSFNENNGAASFISYQIYSLTKQLEELEKNS